MNEEQTIPCVLFLFKLMLLWNGPHSYKPNGGKLGLDSC